MKLFEVVKGSKSANDVLASAMMLGRKIGKVSGLAGNTVVPGDYAPTPEMVQRIRSNVSKSGVIGRLKRRKP